jgi:leucyl/phenylalanyl-tRNA---protein transferase
MGREPKNVDNLLVPADVEQRPLPADIGLTAPRFFPPPTATTAEGLLCVGGRLTPDWLLDAYSHGIFPWPMWDNEPIVWWSPDPRAVIDLKAFHISRRLARTLRSGRFDVTCDHDFIGVIHGCATAVGRTRNTWLTPAMIEAYCHMHSLGYAHSVEVWSRPPFPSGEGSRLVGGTYGVAIGGLFAGESMFHLARDASKVALAHLVAHLETRGYRLFDIQQWTPHTGSLGAIEITRDDYLRRLARVIDLPVTFGAELCGAQRNS